MQFGALPSWPLRWLAALFVALVFTGAGAAPMTVLDRGQFQGDAFAKGKSVRGKPFTLARPGEAVWVAIDFTGDATAGNDAEASFSFFFEGAPIPAADTVALFRARFMRAAAGQQQGDVRRSVLMKMIPTGKWDTGLETHAIFELVRAEGMRPRSLSYVIGQGEMPPEMLAAIDEIRGSWLRRYWPVALLIGGALVLGGVIWRRLLRR